MVLLSRPSWGRTSRRSRTPRARSTSGMACARSSATRLCAWRCCCCCCCGIELQHGALEQAKLGADFAPFEDAEGALHQRHGLRQIERHALVRLALLLLLLLWNRAAAWCS